MFNQSGEAAGVTWSGTTVVMGPVWQNNVNENNIGKIIGQWEVQFVEPRGIQCPHHS